MSYLCTTLFCGEFLCVHVSMCVCAFMCICVESEPSHQIHVGLVVFLFVGVSTNFFIFWKKIMVIYS